MRTWIKNSCIGLFFMWLLGAVLLIGFETIKMQIPMNIIARMKSDFPTKFGIPRQSGLVNELQSTIVFEGKRSFQRNNFYGGNHCYVLYGSKH